MLVSCAGVVVNVEVFWCAGVVVSCTGLLVLACWRASVLVSCAGVLVHAEVF